MGELSRAVYYHGIILLLLQDYSKGADEKNFSIQMSSVYVTGARAMCAYFEPHTFYASNAQVTLSFHTRRSSILPCQFSAIFLMGNADLMFFLSLVEEHHARIYSFLYKNKQTRQNKG